MADFISLQYDNEPTTFNGSDIEKFALWCVKHNVSDITIQTDEKLICEIYGKKHFVTKKRLNNTEVKSIITYIYANAGAVAKLNGAEEIDMAWVINHNKEYLRFRVNMKSIMLLADKGYSISIRIINSKPINLESLNLDKNLLSALLSTKGLIWITGPTGSGKSTLLASVIDWRLRDPNSHLKILTCEAPIEYVYHDTPKPSSSISQVEIGINILTFALGVRNSLRSRNDVVLIGEARDKETIGEVIKAAQTGPLVYTTAHSDNVAETPSRLINEFPYEEKRSRMNDLILSTKLIVNQKLVPSIDGKRIAIIEYLVFNQEIIDALLKTNLENITLELRTLIKMYGKTFLQDAHEKYKNGLIDLDCLNNLKKELN